MDNLINDYTPKIGLCGFNNIGNTCYMNSILQLLLHNNIIVDFLFSKSNPYQNQNKIIGEYTDYLYHGAINRNGESERKKLKLSNDDEVSINRSDINEFIANSITNKLADILNTIIYKGNSCITPTGFKQVIDHKIPSFRGWAQHDSHELLLQILDNIIEETGIESEPEINIVPNFIKDYLNYLQEIKKNVQFAKSLEEKKQIIFEFNQYKKSNNDLINKYNGLNYMIKVFKNRYNPMIFKLKTFIVNTITCTKCKNQTCNYEDTSILTLPVTNSLNDCFNEFIKTEEIENYSCAICNEKNKAIKTSKILRPGMTLFIHLNRFKQLPNGRTLKNNTDVSIPMEIDITQYCDNSMKTKLESNLDSDLKLFSSYKYRLTGMSNHHGGMGGGHYTANGVCIVDHQTWYEFDDSRVSKIKNSNHIDTSSAYILMYDQII